jgi:OFA family oxalate/formate antiporter-like MFS transporter
MNSATTDTLTVQASSGLRSGTRSVQLLLGLICMMAISSPQYVWTLFTRSWGTELGASPAAIQVTFSLLIVLQTFFSPAQGYLIDRFGPRLLIATGVALTGLSWVISSGVTSLVELYLAYGLLGGLGSGIVYVGVVGLMVRWFPDRRGFAAGVVAAGYGMGAILTTFPISSTIASSGFRHALIVYGIVLGVVGVLAALGLRTPPMGGEHVARPVVASARDTPPAAMLRTPLFWLMFVMMAMMSTSGLMVTSQMASFAGDYGLSNATVLGMAAVPLALTLDRFTNGLTRPFFGWVSDRIGRENTMFLAFGLEGIAMAAWMTTLHNPVAFVLLSGVVFFGWGEIFSLFPSTLTDTFGARNATTNYGFLYMAQGVGSILGGPMASLLHDSSGSWTTVFSVAIGADLLTALLAIAVLKSMRRAWMAHS